MTGPERLEALRIRLDTIERILGMYYAGVPRRLIETRAGKSASAIASIVRRYGVTNRRYRTRVDDDTRGDASPQAPLGLGVEPGAGV